MTTNFKKTSLTNLVELLMGQAPSSKDCNFEGQGTPFVKVGEFGEIRPLIREWTTNPLRLAHRTDVLLCVVGATCGKINLGEECAIGRSVAAIRPNRSLLNQMYLYYFMMTHVKRLRSGSVGAAQTVISKEMVENIQIPVLSLPEQERIVVILDESFAAIAKAKANAKKNLQNAKELFESYLQSIFENKGEDWDEKTLGEVLQKTETIDPTKKPNDEFFYLDVSSVNKETKEIEGPAVVLGKDAPSRARKLVKTNDVIFATVRPTHSRVALITEEYDEQVCSTGYFVLRAKDFLSNNFIFYFLLTCGFNKQMEKLQKGASYPAVTDTEVRSIFIPFPKSITEQQNIVVRLNSLSIEIKKLEAIYQQKIAALEELKKSILQKAFNGELAGAHV